MLLDVSVAGDGLGLTFDLAALLGDDRLGSDIAGEGEDLIGHLHTARARVKEAEQRITVGRFEPQADIELGAFAAAIGQH
ncbi:hypothetical protein D9M68_813410 [compost metagenome]